MPPARNRNRGEEERLADKSRAYVWMYLRRGKIAPPGLCEVCGTPGKLVFWHPDVTRAQEVIWLCKRDRVRISATLEPVTLSWKWPGDAAPSVERTVTPRRSPRGTRTADRAIDVARPAGAVVMTVDAPIEVPQSTPPNEGHSVADKAAGNVSTVDLAAAPRPVPDRLAAEAWLSSLSPDKAEAYRAAASSIRGIRISRESPLYGQQIVQIYARARDAS